MNVLRSQRVVPLWIEYLLVLLSGLALLFLFTLGNLTLPHPLAFTRLVLGLLFTLFIPGYYVVASLWQPSDLVDAGDRIALSIGISCALLPLVALVLDVTGLGITLDKIALTEALVIGIFGAVAYVRRSRLNDDGEYQNLFLSSQSRVEHSGRSKLALTTVLALPVIATIIAVVGLALSPPPVNEFTEFYILGQGSGARQYPRIVVIGESVTIAVGVHNQEGTSQTYAIEVRDGGTLIGQQLPFTLAAEQQQVMEVTLTPTVTGETRPIEFLLLRGEDGEIYRRLELLMRVDPASPTEDD
jgi:uncharacterized membrane protein